MRYAVPRKVKGTYKGESMLKQSLDKIAVIFALGALLTIGLFQNPGPAQAAPDSGKTFTVNSIDDEPDQLAGDGKCSGTPSHKCTLRAAVMEANAFGGAVTIILPRQNNYVMQRAGSDNTGLNGDFDIMGTVNLTIVGGNPDTTILDGNQIDRLFDADGGAHLTLKYLTLRNARSDGNGGAIRSGNAWVTLDHVILSTNSAASDGGAIYATGGLTVRDSMIRNNAVGTTAAGGGIFNNGSEPSLLVNTTLYGNYAPHSGGGIINYGVLTLINSTLAGNKTDGDGGGIQNKQTLTLASSTVSENIADLDASDSGEGGGISNDFGTFTVRNSIIADNVDLSPSQTYVNRRAECNGTFTSQGYNLIRVGVGCVGFTNGAKGDKVGNQVFPLEANLSAVYVSGYRGIYFLGSTSPAVQAGNPGGCVDQNNITLTFDGMYQARPSNACDMGAAEFDGSCTAPFKPELFMPLDNARVGGTKILLQWQDNLNCGEKFKVVVKQGSQTGPTVSSVKNLEAFQYTTKALTKGMSYYWRVSVCNAAGCAKSAWGKFTVKP